MKKIEAIIKPFRLDEVKAALTALGIEGMTVLDAKGFGRQNRTIRPKTGSESTSASLHKLRIDIVLEDSQVDDAVKAIVVAAKTGTIGDGKVWISTIDEVVRIRTEEKGPHAV